MRGFHAEMIVTRQVLADPDRHCQKLTFHMQFILLGGRHERHKCIYGYLQDSLLSGDAFDTRAITHVYSLYAHSYALAVTEKVKWKRFIFLPLSSKCDGRFEVWICKFTHRLFYLKKMVSSKAVKMSWASFKIPDDVCFPSGGAVLISF